MFNFGTILLWLALWNPLGTILLWWIPWNLSANKDFVSCVIAYPRDRRVVDRNSTNAEVFMVLEIMHDSFYVNVNHFYWICICLCMNFWEKIHKDHLASKLNSKTVPVLTFSWPTYYRWYLSIIFNVKFWFKMKLIHSIRKTLRWKQDMNLRGAKLNRFRDLFSD